MKHTKPPSNPDTEKLYKLLLNSSESVLMRRMKLEPIIQSEVSQKDRPLQYTNTYIGNLERC